MTLPLALLVLLVAVTLLIAVFYNRYVRLYQNVRESWSAIDTELKRRNDLVPNLVQTVRGYAGHENATLQAVTAARAAATDPAGQTSGEFLQNQNALTAALHRMLLLAEAYPELKADKGFVDLQKELERTETRISQSRRFYNANVRVMNTQVLTFPQSLVASLFGYKPLNYFEMDDPAQRAAPTVRFDAPTSDPATTDAATSDVPTA